MNTGVSKVFAIVSDLRLCSDDENQPAVGHAAQEGPESRRCEYGHQYGFDTLEWDYCDIGVSIFWVNSIVSMSAFNSWRNDPPKSYECKREYH